MKQYYFIRFVGVHITLCMPTIHPTRNFDIEQSTSATA